jgi:hypothetical protein
MLEANMGQCFVQSLVPFVLRMSPGDFLACNWVVGMVYDSLLWWLLQCEGRGGNQDVV